MTEPPSDGQPWWLGGSGAPDVEGLLGPEAMAAVGGVADEALKLFVVLRDRFGPIAEAGLAGVSADPDQAASDSGSTAPLAAVLGQLASGALHAVQDMASVASHALGEEESAEPGQASPVIAPGEAAACTYCPVCQAIALFRSVPMTTWQKLATSVIDVADAARDYAGRAQDAEGATVEPFTPEDQSGASVDDFLRSIDQPEADA